VVSSDIESNYVNHDRLFGTSSGINFGSCFTLILINFYEIKIRMKGKYANRTTVNQSSLNTFILTRTILFPNPPLTCCLKGGEVSQTPMHIQSECYVDVSRQLSVNFVIS